MFSSGRAVMHPGPHEPLQDFNAVGAHVARSETFFIHPLIGPVAQPSPGNGVIFTLWTIPRWRVGSK